MSSRQARINEDLAKSATQLVVGIYYSTNPDGTVQVDFGAGETTCQVGGMFHRTPSEAVWVLRVGAVSLVLGSANMPHSYGSVTAVDMTEMLATVSTDAGPVTLPWVGTTPTVSDVVAIINGWIFVDASVTPTPVGGPGAGTGTRTVDFRATDSGSYNGSWWTNEVWASDNNKGAWFYGTTIGDTIPDTATINKVEVYVAEFWSGYSGLAAIGTHTLATKSGALTISSAAAVAAGAGWRTLANSIGDALKTGTAKGLGYQQATAFVGWRKVSARAVDADSGLLRITFTS